MSHDSALQQIRLLVLDVDGVLTDGGLYYGPEGLAAKRFQAKDGLGLKLLMMGGIAVALLSGDASPIAIARAARLEIPHVLLGVDDKLAALIELCGSLGFTLEQVAYMGDDLNDVPCLSACGFGAAPADALSEAHEAANYSCRLPGGAGCVREVCDLIRHAQGLPIPAMFQAPTLDEPVADLPYNPAP